MSAPNGTRRRYLINLKLPDGQSWFTVCTADSVDSAAEVVRVLLAQGEGAPGELQIVTVVA